MMDDPPPPYTEEAAPFPCRDYQERITAGLHNSIEKVSPKSPFPHEINILIRISAGTSESMCTRKLSLVWIIHFQFVSITSEPRIHFLFTMINIEFLEVLSVIRSVITVISFVPTAYNYIIRFVNIFRAQPPPSGNLDEIEMFAIPSTLTILLTNYSQVIHSPDRSRSPRRKHYWTDNLRSFTRSSGEPMRGALRSRLLIYKQCASSTNRQTLSLRLAKRRHLEVRSRSTRPQNLSSHVDSLLFLKKSAPTMAGVVSTLALTSLALSPTGSQRHQGG